MRRGAETLPTLRAVEAAVDKINGSDLLPPGVRIERIYDRSVLVDITTRTVLHNMVMGVLLIFLIQWLFLGDLRSALIVSATIPFALLFAVVILVLIGRVGEPAVDGRDRLRHHRRRHRDHGREHLPPPRRASAGHGRDRRCHAARLTGKIGDDLSRLERGHAGDLLLRHHHHRGLPAAVHPVGRRGPHLRPDGQDLRLCPVGRPARHLHRLAGAVGAAAAGEGVGDRDDRRARRCAGSTGRVIDRVLAHRGLHAGAAAACWSASPSWPRSSVGLEFLPKLEEGNIWMRAALPPSVSLDEGNVYVNRMRGLVKGFPEVETVISQHGRPDDGTDPDGFSNGEFFVPLKPIDTMAQGPRQGEPDRRDGARRCAAASRASTSPSRSTSRTTSRRRPPASTRRTPSRSAAPTSSTLQQGRRRDPPRAGEGARHHRHPGAAAARPADHPHRHRPPARRALRPVARRHQRHHPGGGRRPGGGRPLRERQRPPLPDDGAARAAIPPRTWRRCGASPSACPGRTAAWSRCR